MIEFLDPVIECVPVMLMLVGLWFCCCGGLVTRACTFCVGGLVSDNFQATVTGITGCVPVVCSAAQCSALNGTYIYDNDNLGQCFAGDDDSVSFDFSSCAPKDITATGIFIPDGLDATNSAGFHWTTSGGTFVVTENFDPAKVPASICVGTSDTTLATIVFDTGDCTDAFKMCDLEGGTYKIKAVPP